MLFSGFSQSTSLLTISQCTFEELLFQMSALSYPLKAGDWQAMAKHTKLCSSDFV